jgi:signal transduction histidine kinase
MGRLLDRSRLERLSRLLALPFETRDTLRTPLAPQEGWASLGQQPRTQIRSAARLDIVVDIPDLSGQGHLIFILPWERSLHLQGLRTSLLLFSLLFLALLIVGALLLLAFLQHLRLLRQHQGALTEAANRRLAELQEARNHQRSLEQERLITLQEMHAKEKAHAELAEAQQRLMDVSRQAGMAEVATEVLHGLGNAINSVNVSSILLREKLESSQISSLIDLGTLLRQHKADLAAFLLEDPRGLGVPSFILQLADQLQGELAQLLQEQDELARNLELVKALVNRHQDYASVAGPLECVALSSLAEDALRLHEASLLRGRIQVFRSYVDLPVQWLDKNQVLQILVNLIQNACQALADSAREEKQLAVHITRPTEDRVEVTIRDNGIGISPKDLTRLFSLGFNTLEGGTGFGLHLGALAAKTMGGDLSAHSDGPGEGATFTLVLPFSARRPE